MTATTMTNPYQFQDVEFASDPKTSYPPGEAKLLELGRLMVRWEQLRFVYNAILFAVTLLAAMPALLSGVSLVDLLGTAFMGVIAANAAYCAGHFVSGYLLWFDFHQRWLTTTLFWLGTGFACLLALGTLSAMMFSAALPNQ